jgi:DNA-binding MarR family transcriptional regulator
VILPGDLPAPASAYLRAVLDADLRLLSIAERLRQHWTAHAAARGLTGAQVKVLLALAPGEAVPMRELATRLDYDASNLTTLTERLRARGMVRHDSDPADRRVKALALTEAGRQARDEFWAGLIADPGPLAQLSESDARSLAHLLRKVETTAGD